MGTDMAAHGDTHGDQPTGSMDISEHLKAWAGFTTFVKWSIIGIILIMGFLAIFRTH
jgi:hypothetical protein